MHANELFSLFAGFIISSFLIWTVTVLQQKRAQKHKDPPPRCQEKPSTPARPGRLHLWNVSSFFNAPAAAPPP